MAIMATMLVLMALMFVDDMDLVVMGATQMELIVSMCHHLQAVVDNWQGWLWATGGTLKLKKCLWACIGFRWEEGAWIYSKSQEIPGLIGVVGPDGCRTEIEQLGTDQVMETLRFWQ